MNESGGKSKSLLTGGPDALKLDPSIKARLDEIEHSLNPIKLQQAFLKTDFKLFQQLNITEKPPVPPGEVPGFLKMRARRVPRKPWVTPGKGPAKTHAADVGDLLSAFMGVHVVKETADRLKNEVTAKPLRDWRKLKSGEKALVLSFTAVIGGGTIAALLSRNESRQQALEFIQGKNIPVPGVSGLSIQISPCGRDKKFLLNYEMRW